jgi:cyclic-di-AMP phosphodiesterase PgpH
VYSRHRSSEVQRKTPLLELLAGWFCDELSESVLRSQVMKKQPIFQSLTQQLTYWRRHYKVLRRRRYLFLVSKSHQGKKYPWKQQQKIIDSVLVCLSKTDRSKYPKQIKPTSMMEHQTKTGMDAGGLNSISRRSPAMFAIAVVSLTGVMGHKLYNQPQLKIHTLASVTIRAPHTAIVENKAKTEEQRKAASIASIAVLKVDQEINEQIHQNLQQLLDFGNEIRGLAGAFPFVDLLVLPLSTQNYLRSCSDSEWQALLLALQSPAKPKVALKIQQPKGIPTYRQVNVRFQYTQRTSTANGGASESRHQESLFQKPDFTQTVEELQAYRIATSPQNLSSLITQISQARQGYAKATTKLLQMKTTSPEALYNQTLLLDLSDDDWSKTKMVILESAEQILTQGIPPGLPTNIIQQALNLQLEKLESPETQALATKILTTILQPNLKEDRELTQKRAKKAAAKVQPVLETVQKGEVIIRKQERITARDFEVLEYYHLIHREINWSELTRLGVIITLAIALFTLVERRFGYRLRQGDRLLVLLLALSTPGIVAISVPYTTWSALGLLLGSFYGSALGGTVVGLMALLLPVSMDISKTALLSGAAGGILGGVMAKRLRSREELALLGIAIALTEGGFFLLAKVLVGAFSYAVLQQAGLFTLSGLAWSIIALGLSPYLEQLFDLVTPIRLAELASPNRPLLKRLATETPGTFQHTLFVATLAEAAAKQLGCNVELVRAGTLYHDIGKIHDPLGFIENQMGGPNKHDTEINNPWKSAAIIKKHVSEGLAMARKHRLPSSIQAFIPEHQGTMLIAYFHHQALQMAQADPSIKVDEADFRYDGPIPQSRETAIVMLADSCEAALRSLKDATPEQALTMLNNILRARWQDNQMIDSGLTREEMSNIAEIFVEVWQQFHHKRIAYPKMTANLEK